MASSTDVAVDPVTNAARDGRVSETVIDAVAAAKDVDPLELEPLYTAIDPDALNAMFDQASGSARSDVELQFSMAGCQVVVRGDGDVVVTPPGKRDGRSTGIAARDE